MPQPAATAPAAALRASLAVAVVGAAVLGLAGCGQSGLLAPGRPSEPATTSAAPSDPGATPAEDEDPQLSAFRAALEGQGVDDPASLVAAVEAAGFDRSAIERTREVDSLGAPVTFVEIAVRLEGSCLVGQVGDGEPIAVRTGPLGGGRCLIGSVVAP